MEISSEIHRNHQYLHEILEGQGSIDGWKDHAHEIKEPNLTDAGDGEGLQNSMPAMVISDPGSFVVFGWNFWLYLLPETFTIDARHGKAWQGAMAGKLNTVSILYVGNLQVRWALLDSALGCMMATFTLCSYLQSCKVNKTI